MWQTTIGSAVAQKNHATCKLYGCVFYGGKVTDRRRLREKGFSIFLLLWSWRWPDDLHIRTWPVFPKYTPNVEIWNFDVKAFESKVIVWHVCRQTDRQTDALEIIDHAVWRVVKKRGFSWRLEVLIVRAGRSLNTVIDVPRLSTKSFCSRKKYRSVPAVSVVLLPLTAVMTWCGRWWVPASRRHGVRQPLKLCISRLNSFATVFLRILLTVESVPVSGYFRNRIRELVVNGTFGSRVRNGQAIGSSAGFRPQPRPFEYMYLMKNSWLENVLVSKNRNKQNL